MACAKTISKYALSASMVIFEAYKQLSFFLEHLISNLKYMEMDQVFLRDLFYYALCFIFNTNAIRILPAKRILSYKTGRSAFSSKK